MRDMTSVAKRGHHAGAPTLERTAAFVRNQQLLAKCSETVAAGAVEAAPVTDPSRREIR